ncbi:PREDICTED: putative RING-H2 finger protein ATL21A isoform X2 [Nelumbo nucifera]|uniref:RING-type E3 ubiquitin transferase n=1 Tax=Nelumbo nucifera TaxID=4432 RepID=A0A1U8AUC0_NELNU|nr:PREDICTED: putative RING-H2 finger protein ATL21A isoform X2 [Nelumbo nucifera]
MGVFFLFLLFFFLFSGITVRAQSCSSSVCHANGLAVRFPFRIKGLQPERCGYPGFDLSCSGNLSRTFLELPFSGRFWVKSIDYARQEIRIGDPNNCLPRRLLHLNLSATPFRGDYYQTYQLFNCSADSMRFRPEIIIPCLSSSTHKVFATDAALIPTGYVPRRPCKLISTVSVPVSSEDYESSFDVPPIEFNDDLRLTWDAPNCGDCEGQDGKCRFKTNTTLETGCFDVPRRGLPRSIRYAISIGVGMPAMMCAVGMACYVCSKVKYYGGRRNANRDSASSTVTPQPTIVVMGLDGATIESYPKLVLGESRRLPKPDDNSCPICLSEYRPNETLRSIPECKHCFHADCIDEWLKINATCPLCRNSPGPLPPPPPLPPP